MLYMTESVSARFLRLRSLCHGLLSCLLEILFIYHVSSALQYYVFIKKAVRLKRICITMYKSHCGALYI